MKPTVRNHFAPILAAIALASACGGNSGYSSSSSSHWVTCQMPEDCDSVPGAVDCQSGYCVDSGGTRVTNDGAGGGAQTAGGSGGDGSAGLMFGGSTGKGGSGSSGSGGSLPAQCPEAPPPEGNCSPIQLLCIYPGATSAEGTYNDAFYCTEDLAVSYWDHTTHLESRACSRAALSGRDLEIDDCATRVAEPCIVEPPQTEQEVLDQAIKSIAETCMPAAESGFEVEFENGCATKLVLTASPAFDSPAFYDCVEAVVATTRFDCASNLACSGADFSTVL